MITVIVTIAACLQASAHSIQLQANEILAHQPNAVIVLHPIACDENFEPIE